MEQLQPTNAAFVSYSGLAASLNVSIKAIRITLQKLKTAKLIRLYTSKKGTTFTTTNKGERYLHFKAKGIHEYSELLFFLQHPTAWRILSIAQNIKIEEYRFRIIEEKEQQQQQPEQQQEQQPEQTTPNNETL